MQDHDSMPSKQPSPSRPSRALPLGILAGAAILALLAGGGTAWWTWHSVNSKPTAPLPAAKVPDTSQASPSPLTQTPAQQTVQVYWLKTDADGIEPTASPVTVAADQPNAVLKAAFEEMLKGSDDPALTSTVPQGTILREVQVKEDGVHVNLSEEFTTGGGSTSMTGRLAQVIYTATTLNPNAPVWISVEGKPLEVLGGEGLVVDQPMTRDSFEENFSY
ncbi:GerMN domain-containing protein [Thermocoleostomius sinensis]|uniref:GerMN domain-containing protein n=1 Tax=Thermocoleostomius sinensis A174 TaxID=2016057 RepID=A0A9E8ZK90_9CYAN|nr:GerMN domain-containing protein [Thermocoleostomius sinensis]WAL62745.1 GerMN domain-containing protein [Thermocoleostomius sinensis A174]